MTAQNEEKKTQCNCETQSAFPALIIEISETFRLSITPHSKVNTTSENIQQHKVLKLKTKSSQFQHQSALNKIPLQATLLSLQTKHLYPIPIIPILHQTNVTLTIHTFLLCHRSTILHQIKPSQTLPFQFCLSGQCGQCCLYF